MKNIKFVDLLKFSDKDLKKLKLVFNSNWTYTPEGRPDCVREIFGEEKVYLDLLDLYKLGKVELVKKSTRLHDPKNKRFQNGEFAFCFIPYGDKDWLLVNAFEVLDDSKKLIEVNEEAMSDYEQYFGRLVISWKERNTRNVRMKNLENIKRLTVKTILEEPYNVVTEKFPGYQNIDISWEELNRVLKFKTWRTALENQKGVYLITDTNTGKRYVGSATSEKGMFLSRWETYAKNGHGNNELLVDLLEKEAIEYVKKYFRYTILEFFSSSVEDKVIFERESWWKRILLTRNPDYGYNKN